MEERIWMQSCNIPRLGCWLFEDVDDGCGGASFVLVGVWSIVNLTGDESLQGGTIDLVRLT